MAGFATKAVFCMLMAVISVYDRKTHKIPDRLVLPVFAVAIVSFFTLPMTGFASRILGMLAVSILLLLFACVLPGSFGGGDIKLMAAGGLFLGIEKIVPSFACAVFAGGMYALFLLLSRKGGKRGQFAFGPFLCAGMAAMVIFEGMRW